MNRIAIELCELIYAFVDDFVLRRCASYLSEDVARMLCQRRFGAQRLHRIRVSWRALLCDRVANACFICGVSAQKRMVVEHPWTGWPAHPRCFACDGDEFHVIPRRWFIQSKASNTMMCRSFLRFSTMWWKRIRQRRLADNKATRQQFTRWLELAEEHMRVYGNPYSIVPYDRAMRVLTEAHGFLQIESTPVRMVPLGKPLAQPYKNSIDVFRAPVFVSEHVFLIAMRHLLELHEIEYHQ